MLSKWPQIIELRAALEAELPPEIHAAELERGQRLDLEEIMATLADQFGGTDGVKDKEFGSL